MMGAALLIGAGLMMLAMGWAILDAAAGYAQVRAYGAAAFLGGVALTVAVLALRLFYLALTGGPES